MSGATTPSRLPASATAAKRTAVPVEHLSDGAAKTSHSRFRSAATASGPISTTTSDDFFMFHYRFFGCLRAAALLRPSRTVADCRDLLRRPEPVAIRLVPSPNVALALAAERPFGG
jgi:hypothetical protein